MVIGMIYQCQDHPRSQLESTAMTNGNLESPRKENSNPEISNEITQENEGSNITKRQKQTY
jgi:hypothetical protein